MREIITITSAQNQLVKDTVKLRKSNSKLGDGADFLLEGLRLCRDAFEKGVEIQSVFATEDFFDKHGDFIGNLQENGVQLYKISNFLGEKLSDTKHPQGVFMVCKTPGEGEFENLLQSGENLLLLDGISDPGNFGTIVRTAFSLGLKHILFTKNCVNPLNPKALRASMGAVFGVQFYSGENEGALLKTLRDSGFTLYTSALHKESINLKDVKVQTPFCLAVGSEAEGVGDTVIAATDYFVEIPMAAGAESLNAATAAGILIWEFTKR